MELQLNEVLIGIGNEVHDHYHRTNKMDLNPDILNQVTQERFQGGVQASTINQLGVTGGTISAQHGGMAEVEGGWSFRRGLMLLKMTVVENSLEATQMSVLGYLTSGSDVLLGIVPDDVLFVPVRSYTTKTTQTQDGNFMPIERQAMTESSQFLMADPSLMKNLHSIRPVDVINYGIGYQDNLEDDNTSDDYDGTVGNSLMDRGVIVSKSSNMNPIVNANTILGHAKSVSRNMVSANKLSENMALSIGGISDMEIYQHPFLGAMMSACQMEDYKGFVGFSFEELRMAFPGFDNAIRDFRQSIKAEPKDHKLTSSSMEGAFQPTVIANELAFICFHALIDVGLLGLDFVASNSVAHQGLGDGEIYWKAGAPASIVNNDMGLWNRVEQFKDYISETFFTKYAAKMFGQSTFISVDVVTGLTRETTVKLIFNNDPNTEFTQTFSSYNINRFSSNIASGDAQQAAAMQYMDNLINYFAN